VLQSGHAADYPCQTCREADRQPTSTVVLLSEVADRFSGTDQPSVGPGAFPNIPSTRLGPRGYFDGTHRFPC
jgi:hypothetical protein